MYGDCQRSRCRADLPTAACPWDFRSLPRLGERTWYCAWLTPTSRLPHGISVYVRRRRLPTVKPATLFDGILERVGFRTFGPWLCNPCVDGLTFQPPVRLNIGRTLLCLPDDFKALPCSEPKMKSIYKTSVTVLACLLLSVLFAHSQDTSIQEVHGIVVSSIDPAVKPGDDFYHFANGNWINHQTIPADRAAVDVWTKLGDLSNARMADLIKEIANSNGSSESGLRKVADLYKSYMDEATIDSKGIAPLKAHLDSIAAIQDKKQLAKAFGETLRADVDALNNTNFHTPNLFGLWVAPGFNDSDHYTPYLMQGGGLLPDREYYLSDSDSMKKIRAGYETHITTLLKLAGMSDPETRAKKIIDLEHAIAEVHRPLAENEDIKKANNTWTHADFSSKAPGL